MPHEFQVKCESCQTVVGILVAVDNEPCVQDVSGRPVAGHDVYISCGNKALNEGGSVLLLKAMKTHQITCPKRLAPNPWWEKE